MKLDFARGVEVLMHDPSLPIYMKGRPSDVSLELFYDYKVGSKGEPL